MKPLVLSESHLRKLCDHDGLRRAMRNALSSLVEKSATNFPRHVLPLQNGALGMMAAESGSIGLKAVAVIPKNETRNLNPHQGLMILFDSESGQVKCLLDGSSLTALRTAAVSAAAAAHLSNRNAHSLALIGAGVQAFEHATAFAKIRPLRTITIFNRSAPRALLLQKALQTQLGIAAVISSSVAEAVRDADLVVTATSAREPILSTLDLAPGTHLSAVGACRPGFREVDLIPSPALKIYLDSRAACEIEAEEIIRARMHEVQIQGEIGSCLQGLVAGRENPTDITVFKSVGLGIEDLAAAEFFFQRARDAGVGQEIHL